MRVPNDQLALLGFKDVTPAAAAGLAEQVKPSVVRSIGVGLLVWFITRWLDGRFT